MRCVGAKNQRTHVDKDGSIRLLQESIGFLLHYLFQVSCAHIDYEGDEVKDDHPNEESSEAFG